MVIEYKPVGVCSRKMTIELNDDDKKTVKSINFDGGCAGNTAGLAKLAEGQPAAELADLLKDVKCPGRSSSCPAQLSKAITGAIDKK